MCVCEKKKELLSNISRHENNFHIPPVCHRPQGFPSRYDGTSCTFTNNICRGETRLRPLKPHDEGEWKSRWNARLPRDRVGRLVSFFPRSSEMMQNKTTALVKTTPAVCAPGTTAWNCDVAWNLSSISASIFIAWIRAFPERIF